MSRFREWVYGSALVGAGILLGTWIAAPEDWVRAFGEAIDNWFAPSSAHAQSEAQTFSPVKALAEHDVYYPGAEDIAPDEMRVTACGTGMPNARPKQAAACFLVELGNGDKFIFDIGSGSFERLSALAIPMVIALWLLPINTVQALWTRLLEALKKIIAAHEGRGGASATRRDRRRAQS